MGHIKDPLFKQTELDQEMQTTLQAGLNEKEQRNEQARERDEEKDILLTDLQREAEELRAKQKATEEENEVLRQKQQVKGGVIEELVVGAYDEDQEFKRQLTERQAQEAKDLQAMLAAKHARERDDAERTSAKKVKRIVQAIQSALPGLQSVLPGMIESGGGLPRPALTGAGQMAAAAGGPSCIIVEDEEPSDEQAALQAALQAAYAAWFDPVKGDGGLLGIVAIRYLRIP
jgi:hypothetical protein